MPLRIAFLSKTDGTLQSYALTLPKGWDPAKGREDQARYPLFVELHGAGHPNALSGVATVMGGGVALDLHGYKTTRTFAQVQRAGYHVMPHGRGNLGYKGVGEADVWEALEDFGLEFGFDEDRQYLYGFSMGGGGTWRLGSRTPDRWAAAAIYAPAIIWRGAPPWVVAENLRQLPVWMWTGEADELIEDQRMAEAALKKYGASPVVGSTPGLSHEYLWAKQEEGIAWLQKHTRKRPEEFSFVADTDEHPGCWGIAMKRDVTVSALPRFQCKIAGNTVRIDSVGTEGLGVKLGRGGLGLAGDLVVIWNGQESYRGPAKDIRLGKE